MMRCDRVPQRHSLADGNDSVMWYGAPGEIRTPDPLVRSQMLYPAELRAQKTVNTDNKTSE